MSLFSINKVISYDITHKVSPTHFMFWTQDHKGSILLYYIPMAMILCLDNSSPLNKKLSQTAKRQYLTHVLVVFIGLTLGQCLSD